MGSKKGKAAPLHRQILGHRLYKVMSRNIPLAHAKCNTQFDRDQPDLIETSPIPVSPSDHVKLLHPRSGRGVASIATVRRAEWVEKAIPLEDLEGYVRCLRGVSDAFVSQQSFWGWRRISQLKEIGANYVDLDYHKTTQWKGTAPETVAWSVLWQLEQHDLPMPSYIMSTGRGLLVVWLLERTSRNACPRWQAAQRWLAEALKGFGADMKALDAARVFRVAGSQNSKADSDAMFVRPVWQSAHWSQLHRYSFDEFADEVLPFTRRQLEKMRKTRSEEKAAREARYLHALQHPRNAGTRWETVLSDLQKLRHQRWFGDLPDGDKDCWLFLAANAMAWMADNQLTLRREIYALAGEAGGWSHQETKARLSSVLQRSNHMFAGRKYKYRGKQVDPLYRFKSSTIVDWLGITETEMREANLRTLVSDTVLRENKTAAWLTSKEEKARAKRQAKDKLKWEAGKLHASGNSLREIEAQLGVARSTLSRWLNP